MKDRLLSGKLSETTLPNVQFIGIDSRLKKVNDNYMYRCAFILSGPEPQRTLLENEIIQQAAKMDDHFILVRGTNNNEPIKRTDNIDVIPLANSEELSEVISRSQYICCRSGYTSLMDLIALKKKAILIPTPGQSEQEYLAKELAEKQMFIYAKQDDFDLDTDLNDIQKTIFLDVNTGYNFAIIKEFCQL
ncbi:MAG: hypothetical protein LRY27_03745 [Chitinophagales bacterium]|nr:hypothetical protein [Chitinophagales bacterium]